MNIKMLNESTYENIFCTESSDVSEEHTHSLCTHPHKTVALEIRGRKSCKALGRALPGVDSAEWTRQL